VSQKIPRNPFPVLPRIVPTPEKCPQSFALDTGFAVLAPEIAFVYAFRTAPDLPFLVPGTE